LSVLKSMNYNYLSIDVSGIFSLIQILID
jgi:hypothetical protein